MSFENFSCTFLPSSFQQFHPADFIHHPSSSRLEPIPGNANKQINTTERMLPSVDIFVLLLLFVSILFFEMLKNRGPAHSDVVWSFSYWLYCIFNTTDLFGIAFWNDVTAETYISLKIQWQQQRQRQQIHDFVKRILILSQWHSHATFGMDEWELKRMDGWNVSEQTWSKRFCSEEKRELEMKLIPM